LPTNNHITNNKQRDETSTDTLTAIKALNRKAAIYTADLSSPEDVAGLVPRILADGHEIRILVNCAGIQRRHPCEKFPDSDFNQVSFHHPPLPLFFP
jgi:2-deoxy-D-gluconate 3-dehydrogenase